MKRSLVLAGTAVAAAASLALLPAAATAHTDNLFSWGHTSEGEAQPSAFLSVGKSDATLTALADTSSTTDFITGTEICDDKAYALDSAANSIITWDHTTGAVISTVPITADFEVGELVELDSLADCTLLTIGYVGEGLQAAFSVDPTTGALALVAELDNLEIGEYTGIATSPGGVTFVFSTFDDNPSAATLDLSDGSQSDLFPLAGLIAVTGGSEGFTAGIDFDAAGGLWFIHGIDDIEELYLATYASGADLSTAEPVEIGIVPYYVTDPGYPFVGFPAPLAADGVSVPVPVAPVVPAQPQLAATGSELPIGIVAIALSLLVAGGAALVLRRRTA